MALQMQLSALMVAIVATIVQFVRVTTSLTENRMDNPKNGSRVNRKIRKGKQPDLLKNPLITAAL
jgi:hypothetical protein